jgi:two-component system, sensor histidine kinase and response regulator
LRHSYEREKGVAENRASLIAEQNKELQKLNQEKTKLLSIISHDLRSPLNSITTVLNLLTNYPLPDNQRIKLQSELLDTTRNTSEMLVNLLSWSSEQMEGMQCRLETLNLKFVIQRVLQIQQPIADSKEVQIQISVDDEMTVHADYNMLELTLRNLINNAIKFTPPLGNVTINASIDQDMHCQIVVRDNGIGMNAEQLEALFSMDIHSTYGTNNEKGIGLGLVLCKEFTEMQNGKIWVHSKERNGSIFYLKIPTQSS